MGKKKYVHPLNPNKRDKHQPPIEEPAFQKGLNINNGDSKQPAHKKVKCIVSNCGTSVGHCLEGDVAEVPETEADFLISRKQFKEVN